MPQPAPVTDDYARHVLARLVDFFTDEGAPWPRRLWDIGSILALEELWEACSWQAAGVLSQSACDWQRNELRAVARSSFLRSGRGGVTPLPHLWVAGHKDPISLHPPARGADVLTLVHEQHLYKVHGARSRIDDALELAAPINQGPLAPAVAGAWAAVESLLSHPDDSRDSERSGKAIAADRFAALVACSWPRAELSTLAHRHSPASPDALSRDIAGRPTYREKARAVAEALLTAGSPVLEFDQTRTRDSDRLAADRMSELVTNPRKVLEDATTTFKIAMRRLYRARNIVLHGGAPRASRWSRRYVPRRRSSEQAWTDSLTPPLSKSLPRWISPHVPQSACA